MANQPQENDPRLVLLRQFLAEKECPINEFAADFITAADKHGLDWRLLPSISFIESGGGKEYTNNNVFGWGNCTKSFPSVRAGIHIVAARLAKSKLYRGKDLDGKLRTYNPTEDYPQRVKSVMKSIGEAQAAVN